MFRTADTYAALPAQIRSRMSELDQHEYWGDDFADGKSEYLLVEKENGGRLLCITYGSWKDFDVKMGDTIVFEHTQTGGKTEGRALAIVTAENVDRRVAKYGDKKLPTWTLK